MFVSSMLKKCANLISNNEFAKECNIPKDEEEVPEKKIKIASYVHDSSDEQSACAIDKENIGKDLTVLSVENISSPDKMDNEVKSVGATIFDDILLNVENFLSGAEEHDSEFIEDSACGSNLSMDSCTALEQDDIMNEAMTSVGCDSSPTLETKARVSEQEEICKDTVTAETMLPISLKPDDKTKDAQHWKPPSNPKKRSSLLSNFDPFYFSPRSPRRPLRTNCGGSEELLLCGSKPEDVKVASPNQQPPILELSTSAGDVTNKSYVVDDESYVIDDSFTSDECSTSTLEQTQIFPKKDVDRESSLKLFAEEVVASVVEDALHTVEYPEHQVDCIILSSRSMADINDKVALQEEENAELKLQLNASQQVRATLELQLRQKEEIIIKSQAEVMRKDQAFKQEIKQLKEKLEEKCVESDNSQAKDVLETIKTLKARETKLLSEINVRKNEEQNYRKIMDEYEKTIAAQLSELQKLKEEHETVKRHLANLELAFSDVHQKYERSKKIIDGYKCNEDTLRQTLMSSEDTVQKSEEKYESLKAHAKAQIEKSNQEMQSMRDQYEAETHKLSAIIRRLEIKNASLTDSLDQKTKECSALSTLCDEVTGKV